MSTAVWMVMCKEPEMFAPASGCAGPNSAMHDMRPGISTCASSISMRLSRRKPMHRQSSIVISYFSPIIAVVFASFPILAAEPPRVDSSPVGWIK